MDITTPLDTIVNNLVRDIETRLNDRVDNLVSTHLKSRLDSIDYDSKLNWLAAAKLDNLIADMEVDQSSVQKRIDKVADIVVNNMEAEARRMSVELIRKQLYEELDINKLVRQVVAEELASKLGSFTFPDRSIPGNAINPVGLMLTGHNITGGVIKGFNSTGIEDKSKNVQMTLLDQGVVIENKVVTMGLEVHGTTVIDGDIHLNGSIPEDSHFYQQLITHAVEGTQKAIGTDLFQGYSNVIFDLIREKGLELDKLSVNGQKIIEGNKLNYGITDTNITRLGLVRDLQTAGEALLVNTLYVAADRVGINTTEPGMTLSMWDQEVEVGFTKRQKNQAWLGTPREQEFVIGANQQDNIVIKPDGSIAVKRITMDGQEFSRSNQPPTHEAPPGSIAWNSAPTLGSPVGWMSLGGGVWSRFGSLG